MQNEFTVYDLKVSTSPAFNKRLGKVVFLAVVKQGRRAAERFAFTTREARQEFLSKKADEAEKRQARKMQRQREAAALKAEQRAKYSVGTMIANSWGYDQTQVDFYQVVKISKTGASVTLRGIASKQVPGSLQSGGMSCKVSPIKDDFTDSDEIKKVIGAYGINFDHGGCSIVTEESELHRSWYA